MLHDGLYKAEMCTMADEPVIPSVMMIVAMVVVMVGIDVRYEIQCRYHRAYI